MKTLKKIFLSTRHLIKRASSRFSFPCIEIPPFSVFSCPEGIKLFMQKTELTARSGFNLSWTSPHGFEDTSSWVTSLKKWNYQELLLQKQNPGNPEQKVDFHLKLLSDGLLLYTLRPSFTPSGVFKTSVLLNPAYKQWFTEMEEYPFPAFKGWLTLSPAGGFSPFAGVSSVLASADLPPVLLHQHKALCHAENSDFSTQARVLCAESASSMNVLKGYLRLFTDPKQFLRWKYLRRNRSVKQQKLLN